MINADDLNLFAQIIDNCKDKLSSKQGKVEESLEYIFTEFYGKILLTMSEIHLLLINGYPEGAIALSRSIFEFFVIISYLYKNKDDEKLIKRCYDDYDIKTKQDYIKFLKLLIKRDLASENNIMILGRTESELCEYKLKYKDFVSKSGETRYFSQYWWIKKDISFTKIQKELGLDDDVFYYISCYRVHAGMAGAVIRFDNSQQGILIGDCVSGKEFPMLFSMLNFKIITNVVFDVLELSDDDLGNDFDAMLKRLIDEVNSNIE